MSRYFEIKQELEECMCPECFGTGTLNDAEPGDTRHNTWTCMVCEGSGINPEMAISFDIERTK